MAQYIIHAAPYSSPNSRKNVKSKWNVQNLRVFQDIPGNPNSTIMAELDLVNANNPKDKKYTMRFSFADGTSTTANAINRIRRFFNEAYDRQRSSSYGFPQLSDTEKTQIVARINTAYNQWAGFSHSDEDADVIDCTSDNNEPDYLSVKMSDIDDNYLEHAANPYPYRPDVKLDGNQLVITFTDVVNNRTATLSVNLVGAKNYKDVEDRLDNLLKAAYADGKDWANISKNAFDSIMRQARSLNIFNDKTVSNRYRRKKSS